MKRRVVLSVLFLVWALVAAGCGGQGADEPQAGDTATDGGAAEDPGEGSTPPDVADGTPDTLRVAVSQFDRESTAKWLGAAQMLPYIQAMYDPPIAADAEGALTKDGIVEDWTFNDAGDEVTLTVREGVRFHNGDELTAQDLAFTLETFTRPEVPTTSGSTLRNIIEGIEVVDDRSLVVRLTSPNAIFLHMLSWVEGDLAVIPKAYYEGLAGADEAAKDAAFEAAPIGTGPYRFVTREVGRDIEFEANDDYWDESRQPQFQHLVLMKVPEASTRVNMLQAGEADLVELLVEQAETLEDAGFGLHLIERAIHGILVFWEQYSDESIFSDVRVRKALTLAVDREAIIGGLYPQIEGLEPIGVAPGSPPLSGPGVVGYSDDLPGYPYDPEEARSLLEESGYLDDPVTIQIGSFTLAGLTEAPRILEAVAEYWKAIGVEVQINATDFPTYFRQGLANPQEFEGPAHVSMTAGFYRPSGLNNFLVFLGSKDIGGVVVSFPDLEKSDALYTEARVLQDPDELDEMMNEVWRSTYEDYWGIPMVWGGALYGANPDVLADWDPVNQAPAYLRFETAVPASQ